MSKKLNLSIPNPLSYFMELSKTIKIIILVGFLLLVFGFMSFTYRSGNWELFLYWLLDISQDGVKS